MNLLSIVSGSLTDTGYPVLLWGFRLIAFHERELIVRFIAKNSLIKKPRYAMIIRSASGSTS